MKYLWFLLTFFSIEALAVLEIRRVVVSCGTTEICKKTSQSLASLADKYRNITHLRQTLKVVVAGGGYKDFVWEVDDEVGSHELRLSFVPKLIIGKINVISPDEELLDYVERNTRLRTGGWHEEAELIDESLRLRQLLSTKGYPRAEVSFQEKIKHDEVTLNLIIEPGTPYLLERVKVTTTSQTIREFAEKKFLDLVGESFDLQRAREKADELETELFHYGYYLTTVVLNPKKVGDHFVIEALIGPTEQWAFDIKEPPLPETDVKLIYLPMIKELFKRYKKPVDEATLRMGFEEELKKVGHLFPKVSLQVNRYQNKNGDWVNHAEVKIERGERTRVSSVKFRGTQLWSETQLAEFWSERASELAEHQVYDETFQGEFSTWLTDQYIRRGFVRAQVPPPKVSLSKDGRSCELEYLITEGTQVMVDELNVQGVTVDELKEVLDSMLTKSGEAFNPQQFSEDLKRMTELLQEKGWYRAEVSNRDTSDIVSYGQDSSTVDINIKIEKGRRITFNRLVIVGNRITKSELIHRKSPFSKGQPVTPTQVRDYESALGATGLFSTTRVRPFFHKGDTALTDVVVEVTERDYGLIEVAPGYRTDIGIKLSGTLSYQNILGENISSSLTGQVNQRLDYAAFDKRRRDEGQSLLEYNITSQLNVPDIRRSEVDYGVSLSVQRRRFFSFDADISRLANTVSHDFKKHYSVSLRHQFESINQFDATEKRDNGSFEIGALTPSLTADFRNTNINPTSGAWFNVSNEIANPLFLSQKKDDLTINFYKLISRNRFYIPIPNGTVAISAVGGIQENLAKDLVKDADGKPKLDEDGNRVTEGYIPNIKVFRLTGLDIVRGFSDEEINRLPEGKDIGDDPVQNKAYMANFKIEPRYFINDKLMAGIFFDAGRVYVNQLDFSDLRQSMGVTFKIVTPVGTLDFDYGVKLLRKRDENGTLESPGRFHVSIGFF